MGERKAQGRIPMLSAPGGENEAAEGCAEEEVGINIGFGTESFRELEFELKRSGGFDGEGGNEDVGGIGKRGRHGL